MFGKVWAWAGTFTQEQNRRIAVDHWLVEAELRDLIDNARYWTAHESYESDEIALRFHHKLTWIHAFPNGNGRHARLSSDLLAAALGRPTFSWGRDSLIEAPALRASYVNALHAADDHDLKPLLAFSRS